MSEAINRLAKIHPRRRPKVADENNRSDTPLSRRSINTTTKPSTEPIARPGQESPKNAEEIFAPIAAQNVMNNTRSRLTVSAGVIIGPRFEFAKVWFARDLPLRPWRRCPDKTEHRGREDY